MGHDVLVVIGVISSKFKALNESFSFKSQSILFIFSASPPLNIVAQDLTVSESPSIIRNMSNYKTIERQSLMFKALSNVNRLTLFNRLMNCCQPGTKCSPDEAIKFCVGELGEGLDIAPSTLSHHLKELNRAGLVMMQRNGKNIECWVEVDVLNELACFFKPD